MSINANTNAKPKASRKLKVVTVVEATPVNASDALVEQLLETTTAHIQNFTINSAVPLVAVPVKRKRATRATVSDVAGDVAVSDVPVAATVGDVAATVGDVAVSEVPVAMSVGDVAVVNKRKSKKSVEVPSKRNTPPPATATDVAVPVSVPVSVGDAAVVNKRKSKKSVSDAEVPSKRSPPKRKPKSKAVMPEIEPFTPSPSAFVPSPSATHNDVEVEEVSVGGVLYYKDVYGNLYDHATFEPINN